MSTIETRFYELTAFKQIYRRVDIVIVASKFKPHFDQLVQKIIAPGCHQTLRH
jgi:hypothetical protein